MRHACPGRRRGRLAAPTLLAVLVLSTACGATGAPSDADGTPGSPAAAPSAQPAPTVRPPEPGPTPTSEEPDVADDSAGRTGGPAPDVLTQEDDGARVELAVGDEVALRLSSAQTWSEPRLDGGAVVLTPVHHLVDPGYVEWLVGAAAPGEATVQVTAEAACEDVAECPPATVTISVRVVG